MASIGKAGAIHKRGQGDGGPEVACCPLCTPKPNSLPIDFSPVQPLPELERELVLKERNPGNFLQYSAQLSLKEGTGNNASVSTTQRCGTLSGNTGQHLPDNCAQCYDMFRVFPKTSQDASSPSPPLRGYQEAATLE